VQTTLEQSAVAVLEWDPGEETVIPNNHPRYASAFTWETEDDTIVPGHHTVSVKPFIWE
jgi:hypothetical protein